MSKFRRSRKSQWSPQGSVGYRERKLLENGAVILDNGLYAFRTGHVHDEEEIEKGSLYLCLGILSTKQPCDDCAVYELTKKVAVKSLKRYAHKWGLEHLLSVLRRGDQQSVVKAASAALSDKDKSVIPW